MSQSEPDQSIARNDGPGMGRTLGACLSISMSSSKAALSSKECSILPAYKQNKFITFYIE